MSRIIIILQSFISDKITSCRSKKEKIKKIIGKIKRHFWALHIEGINFSEEKKIKREGL